MARKPAWKNVETKKKGSGTFFGVFIVFVLLFPITFNLIKNFQYKDNNSRKSANAYLAILGSYPTTLFAYQKDTGRAALFVLDDQKNVNRADTTGAFVKIADLKKQQNGLDFLNTMTLAFRAKISSYILFRGQKEISSQNIKEEFSKFQSFRTPIAILFGGIKRGDVKDTNITRYEAITLWWQLKNLRVENIKYTDLRQLVAEKQTENGRKVLGIDEPELASKIQNFTENDDVMAENLNVILNNPGKDPIEAQLAAGFIASTGANLADVRNEGAVIQKTAIYTDKKSSKTAKYLATLFNCDIKSLSDSVDRNTVMVVLGSDFGKTYIR